MFRVLSLAITSALLGCGARPAAPPPSIAAELSIPVAPQLATFADEHALVFEVLVTNTGSEPLSVTSVELDAGGFFFHRPDDLCGLVMRYPDVDAETLADLTGLREPMLADAALPPCSVPAGRSVFIPVWATAPRDTAPPERVTMSVSLARGEITETVTTTSPERVEEPALVLGPPLRGGRWLVLNGLTASAGHRLTALRMHGAPHWAQRFAADFAALDEAGCAIPEGATFAENTRYFGYGTEVLAVADGRIARVLDGVPENVPGARAVTITTETVTGNAVWLDVGEDRYAFYAHLIPGSITVAEGAVVRRGDVLGRLGNSGNSTSPHLHFHVARGVGGLDTEGVAYAFDAVSLRSATVPETLFGTERCVTLGDDVRAVREALPSESMVIAFP